MQSRDAKSGPKFLEQTISNVSERLFLTLTFIQDYYVFSSSKLALNNVPYVIQYSEGRSSL